MKKYLPEGKHIIADFYGVDFEILNNATELLDHLIQAAEKSGATIISSSSHSFDPEGVTAFVILSESHLSAHTYSSDNVVFIDVFTCGEHVKPELAIEYLEDILKPTKMNKYFIERGNQL